MRDFHRPRHSGNPLFGGKAVASGSKVVRRGAAPGRPARRGTSTFPPVGNIIGILAAVAAIGALWYVVWSPAFRVKEVRMSGLSPATEQTVRTALDAYREGRALLVFPRDNVLFFGEAAAVDAIKKAVYLDSVDIQKKLPNEVLVQVKEKETRAVLDRDGRLYAIDDSGFVLRELAGEEIALMTDLPPGMVSVEVAGLGAQTVDIAPAPATEAGKVTGTVLASEPSPVEPQKNAWPLLLEKPAGGASGRKEIVPGLQVCAPQTLGIVLQANARLRDLAGENPRWFVPDVSADTVDVTMTSGWHAYFSNSLPFDAQAENLGTILKEKIGDKKSELQYVDLRFSKRIYFKLKGESQ